MQVVLIDLGFGLESALGSVAVAAPAIGPQTSLSSVRSAGLGPVPVVLQIIPQKARLAAAGLGPVVLQIDLPLMRRALEPADLRKDPHLARFAAGIEPAGLQIDPPLARRASEPAGHRKDLHLARVAAAGLGPVGRRIDLILASLVYLLQRDRRVST